MNITKQKWRIISATSFALCFSTVILFCTSCAPVIIIDWDNMTYEDIRSYESVIMATHVDGHVITLTDYVYKLKQLDVEESLGNKTRARDYLTMTIMGVANKVIAVHYGWDGTANAMARDAAEQSFARIDRELTELSVDADEARRLFAAKYFMDADYMKKHILNDLSAYYFMVYEALDNMNYIRREHDRRVEDGGVLAAYRPGLKKNEINVEKLLSYLEKGNNLLTYEPLFNHQAGYAFVFLDYFEPDDGDVYEWLKNANPGDWRYFASVKRYEGDDLIIQLPETSEGVLKAYHNMRRFPSMLVGAGMSLDPHEIEKDWTIEKTIERIRVAGS